jgi:ABC-type phosphate transport system permease subunit
MDLAAEIPHPDVSPNDHRIAVPRKMKDAALGMGCTRTQMIWKIVLRLLCQRS